MTNFVGCYITVKTTSKQRQTIRGHFQRKTCCQRPDQFAYMAVKEPKNRKFAK